MSGIIRQVYLTKKPPNTMVADYSVKTTSFQGDHGCLSSTATFTFDLWHFSPPPSPASLCLDIRLDIFDLSRDLDHLSASLETMVQTPHLVSLPQQPVPMSPIAVISRHLTVSPEDLHLNESFERENHFQTDRCKEAQYDPPLFQSIEIDVDLENVSIWSAECPHLFGFVVSFSSLRSPLDPLLQTREEERGKRKKRNIFVIGLDSGRSERQKRVLLKRGTKEEDGVRSNSLGSIDTSFVLNEESESAPSIK